VSKPGSKFKSNEHGCDNAPGIKARKAATERQHSSNNFFIKPNSELFPKPGTQKPQGEIERIRPPIDTLLLRSFQVICTSPA
jgi:hypothetical protein